MNGERNEIGGLAMVGKFLKTWQISRPKNALKSLKIITGFHQIISVYFSLFLWLVFFQARSSHCIPVVLKYNSPTCLRSPMEHTHGTKAMWFYIADSRTKVLEHRWDFEIKEWS